LFSRYASFCVASPCIYKAGTPDSSSRLYKLNPVLLYVSIGIISITRIINDSSL